MTDFHNIATIATKTFFLKKMLSPPESFFRVYSKKGNKLLSARIQLIAQSEPFQLLPRIDSYAKIRYHVHAAKRNSE